MTAGRTIKLRGVRVHNLKGVDLDIPHRQLTVMCGVSGSGKSSLALDTLYAEGQRRYIESFSAYTRQFLERLEKPAADRIDDIPPAVAVTHKNTARGGRSTVGTATEISDYLRLLFAKIAEVFCRRCGQPVRQESAESVADSLLQLAAGTRYLLGFERRLEPQEDLAQLLADLRDDGFVRIVIGGQIIDLTSPMEPAANRLADAAASCFVIVDRLSAGTPAERVRDSVETAFAKGDGRALALIETADDASAEGRETIDGRTFRRASYSNRLRCDLCNLEYLAPEPRLFSFNSPLGACPECEGFGSVIDVDLDLIVPDRAKSLREGAIAPWNTPAYAHELEELLALANDYALPADVPFSELTEDHLRLIQEGVPERNFGGLRGFFAWLERKKYKLPIRVFLSRWRSYRTCPVCGGSRLRPEALDVRLAGWNIAQVSAMKISEAARLFERVELTAWQRSVGQTMLEQVQHRLGYLSNLGLGYLTLDRSLRTLSGGESQRVTLTTALGSSLVNMLYVLDEPSVGLHPHDTDRLVQEILRLRDRGNTVVAVEHDEALIWAADRVVEIGPAAGERGGKVVFEGTPAEIEHAEASLTGSYLAGRRGVGIPGQRRCPSRGWIRLTGARGNNLQNLTVEFPLGLLCVVTGVSGSGKSTLVEDTLYPALCRRMRKSAPKPLDYDDVFGDGQIDDVVLVDQSPIGRSPRSNPVTYIKAFDDIRAVFAETLEARTHGYTASHFSFNAAEGRCPVCEGDGCLQIDMQFLADVYMPCPECRGARYRNEILEVRQRGLNISEVLELTVREAHAFFRGRAKVQSRLKRLIDVGLDYLRLGQPANTLSGGEAQRLKLAGYLSAAKRSRCLFILDEPTTGLHFSDVVQLLDCFEALLDAGHSLIVVEHNLQLMKSADYLIDLGPGAADEGGQVVVQGTPELVAQCVRSLTGQHLAPALARRC